MADNPQHVRHHYDPLTAEGIGRKKNRFATALVIASYPCDLTVMGVNFKSSCTLTAQSAQMVQ